MQQLNSQIRQGHYAPGLFKQNTGRDLRTLWTEFQSTTGFTAAAAEANKLYDSIGYKDGKPPGRAHARFEEYLKGSGELEDFRRVMAYFSPDAPKDILFRYAFYRFVNGPSGVMGAFNYLVTLNHVGQLPGFETGDKGQLGFGLEEECHCEDFPVSRTIIGTKTGDQTRYHYTVTRESRDSPWKLQKAWQTAADGSVLKEFQLP